MNQIYVTLVMLYLSTNEDHGILLCNKLHKSEIMQIIQCLDNIFPMQQAVDGLSKLLNSHYLRLWLCITRPTLERRKTLGHLRSINRNMIIHFANQSQTCQLLKILKNIFFEDFMKRNCEVVQSIPGWTDTENPYRLSRASYIYIICRVLALTF